jgi:hypothetical protein
MLLFWSEEHVQTWRKDWRMEGGEVFSLQTCWGLAEAWYGADRREPEWRRKTVDEAQAVFDELGLTSAFWHLPR